MYGGLLLVADSVRGWVAGGLFLLFIFLAPFSEEIWLREQFGEEYEAYLRNVPRFIGRRKKTSNRE